MLLETSDDFSFFLQAGILSMLCLVVARTDDFPGGFTGGVDEVKGGSLTKFDRDDT